MVSSNARMVSSKPGAVLIAPPAAPVASPVRYSGSMLAEYRRSGARPWQTPAVPTMSATRRSAGSHPMTEPSPEEQRFHWSEGNKYALEAMKALLWLNGGSAAALLTLLGGTRPRPITPYFGFSITSFAVGAALAIWAYSDPVALRQQGHYQNRPMDPPRGVYRHPDSRAR
jgi:hypothetical protein